MPDDDQVPSLYAGGELDDTDLLYRLLVIRDRLGAAPAEVTRLPHGEYRVSRRVLDAYMADNESPAGDAPATSDNTGSPDADNPTDDPTDSQPDHGADNTGPADADTPAEHERPASPPADNPATSATSDNAGSPDADSDPDNPPDNPAAGAADGQQDTAPPRRPRTRRK